MFTRKRFQPPVLRAAAGEDIAVLAKAVGDYLLSLEAKNALTIDSATGIDSTPIGANAANTGRFTTLTLTTASSTYTPTITASAGTFTSVSAVGRYLSLGNIVFVYIEITITTNGTASGQVLATLPATALTNAVMGGRADGSSGKALTARVAGGSNSLTIFNYDNTYPGSSGESLKVSGFFFV